MRSTRSLACLVVMMAIATVTSQRAWARGVPSWAKGGVLHVELGAPYDSHGLPANFASGKGHSAYPDGITKNQHVFNLLSGGLIHTGGASSADGVYAWHNKPWSYAQSQAGITLAPPLALPSASPSAAINLVTQKESPKLTPGTEDTRV